MAGPGTDMDTGADAGMPPDAGAPEAGAQDTDVTGLTTQIRQLCDQIDAAEQGEPTSAEAEPGQGPTPGPAGAAGGGQAKALGAFLSGAKR